MPAFSLTPQDNGSGWIFIGPHWQSNTMGAVHNYPNVSNLPGDAVAIEDPVTQWLYATDAFSAGSVFCYHRFNGSTSGCAGHVLTGGSFSFISDNRSGLTVAALNACSIGMAGPFVVESRVNAYQASLTGTYLTAQGGFVPLFFAIGPLIGIGLTLAQMPALSKAMGRVRQPDGGAYVRVLPGEYSQALEEWKAYRHPRFAFLRRS